MWRIVQRQSQGQSPPLRQSAISSCGSWGRASRNHFPAIRPRIIVPSVGNKTQREVSARVVIRSDFSRGKQIQEPLVEAISKIVVLVPVRGEPREVVLCIPRRRNAKRVANQNSRVPPDTLPTKPNIQQELRPAQPMPTSPVPHPMNKIRAGTRTGIRTRFADKRIFKREIRHGMVHRAKKYAQRNQHQ